MKIITLYLLSFLLLVSCGTTPPIQPVVEVPQEPQSVVLTVAVDSLPTQYDPTLSGFGAVSPVLTACYEGLFSYDSVTGVLVNAICKDYTVSDDGLTYTFNLRTDAKYSNGDVISADDFVTTFFKLLDGEGEPEVGERLSKMISGADSYVLPVDEQPQDFTDADVAIYSNGPYELEIILNEPVADFVAMLASPVFSPTYSANNPPAATDASQELQSIFVTSGPYTIASATDGEVIAIKNNNYYNMLEVTVDQVVFSAQTLDETLDFANETLNVVVNPNDNICDTFPSMVYETASFNTAYISFNNRKSPTNNVLVRDALSLAINREELAQSVSPTIIPATGLVPPGYIYGDNDFVNLLERNSFNTQDSAQDAQKLLDTARFPEGVGLRLSMIVNKDDPYIGYYKDMADMITENTGADLSLIELNDNEFEETIERGDYNMAVAYTDADVLHPAQMLSLMTSTNHDNDTGFGDNIYDDMLATAAVNPKGIGQQEILQDAEVHLMANMPITPLFYPTNRILINDNTDGVLLNAVGNLYITNAYVDIGDELYEVDGF